MLGELWQTITDKVMGRVHPSVDSKALEDGTLPELDPDFRQELEDGYYTGLLETYGVSWDMEKAARDVLQNFYDPKQTLDDVHIDVSSSGGLSRETGVMVRGEEYYDFRKLLHLGGTDKANSMSTAGGFGEGAKVLALVLLRDYGFKSVTFGSGDWRLEFFLRQLPEGQYDIDEQRGLYVSLRENAEHFPGNYFEAISSDRRLADELNHSKDLFYHSEHPDFEGPNFTVSRSDGAEFGFKVLGRGKRGHLYDCGQRRHYRKDSSDDAIRGWAEVEGVHLWTRNRRLFNLDRDRGAVAQSDVQKKLVSPMARGMSDEQLVATVGSFESIWKENSSSGADHDILVASIHEMKRRGLRIQFPKQYYSAKNSYQTPREFREHIERKGMASCIDELSLIGMPTAQDLYSKLDRPRPLQLSPEQLRMTEIIRESLQLLNKHRVSGVGTIEIPRSVRLYNPQGQDWFRSTDFPSGEFWFEQDFLKGTYAKALQQAIKKSDYFDRSATELVINALTAGDTGFAELRYEWNGLQSGKIVVPEQDAVA